MLYKVSEKVQHRIKNHEVLVISFSPFFLYVL